jgi:hypothetical protein
MPSYRERREAGEFEVQATKYDPGKPALEAIQEAAAAEEPETPDETPAPRQRKSGIKVTTDE